MLTKNFLFLPEAPIEKAGMGLKWSRSGEWQSNWGQQGIGSHWHRALCKTAPGATSATVGKSAFVLLLLLHLCFCHICSATFVFCTTPFTWSPFSLCETFFLWEGNSEFRTNFSQTTVVSLKALIWWVLLDQGKKVQIWKTLLTHSLKRPCRHCRSWADTSNVTDSLSNQRTKKLRIFIHFARGALNKTPSCICNRSTTPDGGDISWRRGPWKHCGDLGNFETPSVGVCGSESLLKKCTHFSKYFEGLYGCALKTSSDW